MTTTTETAWFVADDGEGSMCLWLGTPDDDQPEYFASFTDTGYFLTPTPNGCFGRGCPRWPGSTEEFGRAMAELRRAYLQERGA